MSTHMLSDVEELCDRILLVDKGKDLLYGKLNELRKQFSGHAVIVRSENEIPDLDGVLGRQSINGATLLTLAENTTPQDMLRGLVAKNVIVEQFEIAVPSLDEIFIKVVGEGKEK